MNALWSACPRGEGWGLLRRKPADRWPRQTRPGSWRRQGARLSWQRLRSGNVPICQRFCEPSAARRSGFGGEGFIHIPTCAVSVEIPPCSLCGWNVRSVFVVLPEPFQVRTEVILSSPSVTACPLAPSAPLVSNGGAMHTPPLPLSPSCLLFIFPALRILRL